MCRVVAHQRGDNRAGKFLPTNRYKHGKEKDKGQEKKKKRKSRTKTLRRQIEGENFEEIGRRKLGVGYGQKLDGEMEWWLWIE